MRLIPGQSDGLRHSEIVSLVEQLALNNDTILSQLSKLNIDLPRFSATKVKSVDLAANTITKIVSAENRSRRTTLQVAEDSTCKSVILLHGYPQKPTLEEMNSSPWALKPGDGGTDDLDGGYDIWALAVNDKATIKIGLEYEKTIGTEDNLETGDNLMKVEQLFGVGKNWNNAAQNRPWHAGYEDELNSATTGFKLFLLSGFELDKEYTFSLNPQRLIFQPIAHPINIYLCRLESIMHVLFWKTMNRHSRLSDLRNGLLPILKEGNWAARLPPAGGNFTVKSSRSHLLGLIDAKVIGETYAETCIFNFEPTSQESGTFFLEGY